MNSAALTLIPTPIDEVGPLSVVAREFLHSVALDPQVLLLVEELKVARGRWLKWGLPRESIERFIAYNEHTAQQLEAQIIKELKGGKRAIIISDGGLPAFCDPGQSLVNRCHAHRLKVTAAPFDNSIALAVALSGFSHQQFYFAGFLPQKDPERAQGLKNLWARPEVQIIMETPYRRQRLLEELLNARPSGQQNRRVFIALELGKPRELLVQGKLEELISETQSLEKLEFVLLMDQLHE